MSSPLVPVARTVTMRDLENDVAHLRSENESLKTEVHRLRKIEAGWFPPREGNTTNVTVHNNYEQRINQYIEEINALQQELHALHCENAHLFDKLQRVDDGLANDLRTKLAQAQFENSTMVGEMQRLNQTIESERALAGDLRDQLERLRSGHLREIQDAEEIATRGLKASIAELRLENARILADLDIKTKLVVSLETRLASFMNQGEDDTGAKDRDRIIEHYKLKWDEIRKDNARLRNLLLQKEEEIQAVMVRAVTEPPNASRQEHERALTEAFKAEIAQLRNEVEFHKRRSQTSTYEINNQEEDLYEEVNVHHEDGREHRVHINTGMRTRGHDSGSYGSRASRLSRFRTPMHNLGSPSGDEAQSIGFSPPSRSPFASGDQISI